jgi:hypothetical protein
LIKKLRRSLCILLHVSSCPSIKTFVAGPSTVATVSIVNASKSIMVEWVAPPSMPPTREEGEDISVIVCLVAVAEDGFDSSSLGAMTLFGRFPPQQRIQQCARDDDKLILRKHFEPRISDEGEFAQLLIISCALTFAIIGV